MKSFWLLLSTLSFYKSDNSCKMIQSRHNEHEAVGWQIGFKWIVIHNMGLHKLMQNPTPKCLPRIGRIGLLMLFLDKIHNAFGDTFACRLFCITPWLAWFQPSTKQSVSVLTFHFVEQVVIPCASRLELFYISHAPQPFSLGKASLFALSAFAQPNHQSRLMLAASLIQDGLIILLTQYQAEASP